MARHTVLLVDDEDLVRDALRVFLDQQSDFQVVGEARDGKQAVSEYEHLLPDLVLMDLQMPIRDGVEATAEICRGWPEARIVVMTTFGTRDYVVAALRSGAAGYLLKDVGGPGLIAGLNQALAGEMPLSAAIRRLLVADVVAESITQEPPTPLSARERELLRWLAQGLTNQQIGNAMFISEGSVKQYLTHIGAKLQCKNRTQILVKAIQYRLVDPADYVDDAR